MSQLWLDKNIIFRCLWRHSPSLSGSFDVFINKFLLNFHLQDMRAAVTNLQSRNARMEVKELSSRLAALPKINLHSKTSGIKASQSEKQDKSKDVDNVSDLGQLMSRCNKARQELYTLISSQPIVDITR